MSLGRHVGLQRFDTDSAEPDQYETITDAVEISGIEMSADTVEDTPYGASESDFRSYDYGLKDAGETTLTITYKSGNAQAESLVDAFNNSTIEKLRFVFPADIGVTWSCDALITSVGVPMGKGEKLRRTLTVKWSGEPVEAAI
ncbi:phage tail tube protein [Bermanella sp. R86510]|uniref:phage tail tube protein n=1 Tax=unclassified Bermanella TaxID=2627862 RepID=UPI0037C8FD09